MNEMTRGGIMSMARRLQNLWVRLRLLPENGPVLQFDAGRPVCYVIHENWLSDRLALYEAVRQAGLPMADAPLRLPGHRLASADFSLRPAWRLFGGVRVRQTVSPRLVRLVAALAGEATFDLQLIPVTVLWGRAPKQQDGILRALFAESWQRRNPLGHWLAVLLHGRHAHIHFGSPLSLREVIADEKDVALAAKKCARVLRTHFRRQREAAIGPDVSHRHTQVETLLGAAEVRAAIEAEAARENLPLAAVEERARRHARAIASDYSYSVVRAGEILLNWVWTRLFDGVEVRNFEVPTRLAAGQSLVYVPCHRSHIDYLLLSYVIFRGGLTPPHVAAGDNLDLPLLGRLLRRGGAFFLRRSFKGDPLYATVFAEYLHLMLARGFPIEFFIEGGRSRSGRLLPPKAGLLGMTVQSFMRRHERPLVFIPVYIGYEKLPEGASFVGELAGRRKQRESWWGVLSSLRILRRHFGRVYVNFGDPLPLSEWLDLRHPGWRSVATADWPRAAVGEIAEELARRINGAALLNPVNLVALALLATPKATADAEALAGQIEHLQALLPAAQADAIAAPPTGTECIAAALRLAAIHRIEHPLGALIAASAEEAALLAYFRNNVLHLHALPALVACLILQHGPLAAAVLEGMVAGLFGLLRTNLYLRLNEDGLPQALEEIIRRMTERGLIAQEAGLLQAPGANSVAYAELAWLGEIVRPQMERHFLVLLVLRKRGAGLLTRRELAEQCHLLAQRLALLHGGKTPEFADKSLFDALVGHLLDNGVMHEDRMQRLAFGPQFERAAEQAETLIAPDVCDLIRRLS
jgi:glycerol-3-phosphate O-acyltransferase